MKSSFIRLLGVAALGSTLSLTSCVSPYAGPNERNGAVIGAAGGALLGGVIGNQSGRGLEGAAIGGLLGSLAGQQIGQNRDRQFFINRGRGWGAPVGFGGFRPSPALAWGRGPVYRTGFSSWGGGFGSPFGFGPGIGFGRGFGGYCW